MASATKIASALNDAIERANSNIVKDALSSFPKDSTVADVMTSFEKAKLQREFRALSLSELLSAVGGATSSAVKKSPGRRRGSSKASASSKAGARKTTRRKKTRNTRTKDGREAMDQDVLAALAANGGAGKAEDLRKLVGGTSAQLRDSMKRLAKAKQVKITGQKRATEYHLK